MYRAGNEDLVYVNSIIKGVRLVRSDPNMFSFPLFVSKYNSKPQQFELYAIRRSDLSRKQASLHLNVGSIACEQLLNWNCRVPR